MRMTKFLDINLYKFYKFKLNVFYRMHIVQFFKYKDIEICVSIYLYYFQSRNA